MGGGGGLGFFFEKKFLTLILAKKILLNAVLLKYFRVLSDIGLTEFKILSDQTFLYSLLLNYVELFGVIFINLKEKSTPSKV